MRCQVCGDPSAVSTYGCPHSYRGPGARRKRLEPLPPAEIARRMKAAATVLQGIPDVMILVSVGDPADLPSFGRARFDPDTGVHFWRDDDSSHGEIGTVTLGVQVVRCKQRVNAETEPETLRLPPPPAAPAPRALPPARPLLALPPKQGQVALPGLLLLPGPDVGAGS